MIAFFSETPVEMRSLDINRSIKRTGVHSVFRAFKGVVSSPIKLRRGITAGPFKFDGWSSMDDEIISRAHVQSLYNVSFPTRPRVCVEAEPLRGDADP